jgi:hypothetical protein
MLLSRRLLLPALGALALAVSAGAVWKAQAQGGFSLTQLTANPNPVTGGATTLVRVKVNMPAGTTLQSVRAQTLAGNGLLASGPIDLTSAGGGFFQGNLTSPKNNTTAQRSVTLRVTATRATGTPRTVRANIALRVNRTAAGGGGGGTNPSRPPAPPNI